MNYLSIQTLSSVFQGTISLFPLPAIVWGELKINEKIQLMGINKHHGTPYGLASHRCLTPFAKALDESPLL